MAGWENDERAWPGYLDLSRTGASLSGGEARESGWLAQVGSRLRGVMYVLDEPTIGLHQRDNGRLIKLLRQLRDAGNSIIVVEHDEQTISLGRLFNRSRTGMPGKKEAAML
jgi:excinuclease UvrABC ATPase subunit